MIYIHNFSMKCSIHSTCYYLIHLSVIVILHILRQSLNDINSDHAYWRLSTSSHSFCFPGTFFNRGTAYKSNITKEIYNMNKV